MHFKYCFPNQFVDELMLALKALVSKEQAYASDRPQIWP